MNWFGCLLVLPPLYCNRFHHRIFGGFMKATIHMVAKEANVSVSTVSRVLNNNPAVLPETRERVLNAIRELDYRPNQLARSLSSKGLDAILLISTRSSSQAANNPYFGSIINAIGMVAEQTGYELILHTGSFEDAEINKTLNMVESRLIKGVVLLSSRIESRYIQKVSKTGVPIVVIGRYDPSIKANNVVSVDTDNYNDCREIGQYLAQMGHRRIGCIHAPLTHYVATDRVEGFKHGLEQSGISADPALFVSGGDSVESAYRAALDLLCSNPPTAIFTTDDVKALGVYKAANNLHLRIPEDLSVFGHNDFDFAALLSPPLTTTRVPIHELGLISASKLFSMIENGAEEHRQILPTDSIIRSSVRHL